MKVGEFLSRLEGVRKHSGEWKAKCPAHKDDKPSLSVKLGDGGRILVICFAGCSSDRIVASLGLSLSDLFDGSPMKGYGPSIVATYDYFDERGGLLYQVRRTADKEFPVYHQACGRWVAGLNGQRRVLYRLPELVQAQASDYVFIVEGEKDVENLRKLGLVATCNSGGAGKGKWRAEYNDSLRNRHVVILPDNDDAGRVHAQVIAEALTSIASSVRVVELPGLPPKGDVSDWIASGGARDDLLKLVQAVATEEAGLTAGFYDSLQDLFSANLAPSPPILFGIRRGQVGSLLAITNVGKTTILLNTCLSLATGLRCDPLIPTELEPMRVMFIDFESTGDELREDLRIMLGNIPESRRDLAMRNFKPIVDGIVDNAPLALNDPSHLEFIEAHAKRNQADLIVIDHVSKGFNVSDENSNAEATKRVMKPLARMARRLNTAIIFTHHQVKPNESYAQGEAAYHGRGASAYGALSRAVFTLTRDTTKGEDWVILKCAKVKGQPFEPVSLKLERQKRWFSLSSAPPASEDELVMAQDVADYVCMRYHDETRTRLVRTEEIAAFS